MVTRNVERSMRNVLVRIAGVAGMAIEVGGRDPDAAHKRNPDAKEIKDEFVGRDPEDKSPGHQVRGLASLRSCSIGGADGMYNGSARNGQESTAEHATRGYCDSEVDWPTVREQARIRRRGCTPLNIGI